MTYTATEFRATRSSTRNLANQGTLTRTFDVDAPADIVSRWIQEGANGSILIEGLEYVGAVHPDIPDLLLTSYANPQDVGSGHCQVVATYSTLNASGTAVLFGMPVVDGSLHTYDLTFEDTEIAIPWAWQEQFLLDEKQQDGTYTRTPVYHFVGDNNFKIRETRVIVSAQWRFPGVPDFNDLTLLSILSNKIQTINGHKWLFKVGNMNAMSNDHYEMSGTWIHDRGTQIIYPRAGDGQDRYALPGTNGVFNDGAGGQITKKLEYSDGYNPSSNGNIIRQPYHSLSMIPADGSPKEQLPYVTQIADYDEDSNGFNILRNQFGCPIA